MNGLLAIMPFLDFLFIVACLTLGFGVSLASYRFFALRNDWPMGRLHAEKPFIPIMLGGFTIVIALLFASARQYEASRALNSHFDGVWIVLLGAAWAVFWTGTMRVGSQASLFLAPLSTLVLIMAWSNVRPSPGYVTDNGFVLHTYAVRAPLPERAPRQQRSLNMRLAQEHETWLKELVSAEVETRQSPVDFK